jgi:hypothetical protein
MSGVDLIFSRTEEGARVHNTVQAGVYGSSALE